MRTAIDATVQFRDHSSLSVSLIGDLIYNITTSNISGTIYLSASAR